MNFYHVYTHTHREIEKCYGCVCRNVRTYTYSGFSLFTVVLVYKATANTE